MISPLGRANVSASIASPLATVAPVTPAAALTAELLPYAAALRAPFVQDMAAFGTATRYDIDLALQADGQHITGTQLTRYVNRSNAPLHEVLLRLYPNTAYMGGSMDVSDLHANGTPVQPAPFVRVSSVFTAGESITDTSVLSVPLSVPLQPGQSVALSMTFTITVPPQANTGYRTFGWSNGILALPNTYAMIPVHDARGWQVDATPTYGDIVFSETSLYRLRLRAPAAMRIVATGVCEETPVATEPSGADATPWKEVSCVAGPVRDMAIHGSNQYEVLTATMNTDGSVLVSSFYMPGYQRGGQRALAYAVEAMTVYARRFGSYPFKELKIFASPTTVGGIEYPMLAGVTDSLYNMDGGYFDWITAHEVAHQWWYGLVGSDPVNEAWLDEALTQYAASLYIEDRYGPEAAVAERERYFNARYERERLGGRDDIVAQPTGAFERTAYSPLVYGKGPLFFDAVRRAAGDRSFNAWLRVYFTRYRYKIARAEDLLAVADEVGIGSLTRQAYAEWIRGVRRP
jgi:hypothetical protein